MSGIFGNGQQQQTTRYAGIQVQSSQKGIAIPRGWGTFKASCNLIDYTNFISTVQSSSAGGGKGGGGGKSGGTTYDYTANVLLSVVAQQIYGIRTVWRDSNVYIDGTSSSTSLAAPFAAAVFSLSNTQTASSSIAASTSSSTTSSALLQAGLSLATGAIGQAACSAVSSSNTTTYWMYNANQTQRVLSTSHAIGYSGQAYVYATNYALNGSATIPNHSFEVQTTIRQVIAGITQDDANPADIINDFLPSISQWPAGIIGSTANLYNYCLAAGLLISPYVDSGRSGADLLAEILTCSNSNVVMSNGQLQFIPYGDTAITGNGVTFTPNLTPVYALQWSDIIDAEGDDPIKWDIRPQEQCYNYVQVSYLDRTNQYVSDLMPGIDSANIAQFGSNKQDPVTLNSICLPTVASQVAQLMVQRSVNIRKTCSFKLPWTFGLLDPMDLITIPMRDGSTKLVRILEAPEKNGDISIIAEEVLVGSTHAAQYTRQAALPSTNNTMVAPGNASTPLIIHPPASLVSDNEIWIAACSNYELWGGAVVWVSTDGTNYNAVGTLQGPSTMGVLTSALASYGGANPDTTDTLAVDMSMSAEVLQPVTATDAAKGITLAIVDNELVTYQSATLTGINTYSLTSLYRAFGGTAAAAHSSGAPIVFLNGNLFKYKFNANQIGQTLYVKLQSFNIYGGGYQNLATISAYTITLAQTYTSSVAWANVNGTGKPQDNATANAVRGAWVTATAYNIGDIVYYGGASYSCLTAHTSAAGNIPPSANWQVFAAAGVNPVVGYLTNAAVTLPANSAGIVTSYAAATGTFKVFSGTTDVTTSAAFAADAQTNCTATVNATTGAYSVTAMTAATASFTMSATYGSVTVTQTFTLATSPTGATGLTGATGAAGANGTRTAEIEMYQWAASAPTTFPSGTSTYTWANGAFTAPATPNSWTTTPGAPVAGQTLYGCLAFYTDSATTTTSTITWAASTAYPLGAAGTSGAAGATGATGSTGAAGANGTRTAVLTMYQWAATQPTTYPSGTSTYTWAGATFTAPATPNSWTTTAGAPVAGQTLWLISQAYADSATTTTSTVTWASSAPYAGGHYGATGPGGPVVLIASTNGDAFTFTDGAASPASQTLNFVANRQNTSGSITWSSSPSVTLGQSGTGNVNAALTLANFGANSQVAITATDSTTGAADTITVVKLTASTAAANADVTGSHTAAAIAGQGALATSTLTAAQVTNALVAAGSSNRVQFSQFESGLSGWTGYAETGSTFSSLTATTVGSLAALSVSGSSTNTTARVIIGQSFSFAVTAGETLFVAGQANAGSNTNVAAQVVFYNSAGAYISELATTATVAAGTSGRMTGIITAPAGAVLGIYRYELFAVAAGAVSAVVYQPMVCGAQAGQSAFPPFAPGPNAFNGADVTSANTSANTSNVGTITAGSVASTINSGGGVATNQVTTASLVLGAATAPNASLNAAGTGSSATYLYKQFSGGGSTYTTPTGQTLTSVTFTSTGGFIRLDLGVSLATVTSSSPLTGVSGSSQQIALVRTQSGVSTVLQSWPYSAGVSEFWVDTGAAAGSVTYSIQFLPCPTGGVSAGGGSGTGAQIYSNTQTLNVSWSGSNLVAIEYRR